MSVGTEDALRFRSAIAGRFGLLFDESKLDFLAEVLERRAGSCGEPPSVYLERLEGSAPGPGELGALAEELTVAETYFFRHLDQFRAVAEVALPDRMGHRAAQRALSLLSAGCASGEEAYSLAILCRDLASQGWQVSIRGVDVNPAALTRARAACYSPWALRETPAEVQARWFRPNGRQFCVDPAVRAAVHFEERNLVQDDTQLWQTGAHDIVFCRNVLMYLGPEHARRLVAGITRSLLPGGYLFLGHAETLRGLSHDFHLRHTHDTFYYQRKDVIEAAGAHSAGPASCQPAAGAAPLDLGWTATWIETVQRASDRIRDLAGPPARPAASPAPARAGLGATLELLERERFSEALDSMRGLPAESARDPDALLLRAVLLTHSGKLDAAETVCGELLALDDLDAGAHYLLALCREGAGDRKGAIEHDQAAAYLDPGFAMPRLHLGLLARRGRDRETARRELTAALSLLEQEEAARLLLFGGGFRRDALVALCRAELVAAGGKP